MPQDHTGMHEYFTSPSEHFRVMGFDREQIATDNSSIVYSSSCNFKVE